MPFFGSLDAEKIAEIAALLKPWAVPERYTIIRRGEAADSMYFIVSGDVEVDLPPNSFHLTTGEYFGEMGIVSRSARVANVMGTSINDATDVKLGRSRGSRGSRSGVGVGVFGVLRLPGGSVPLSMRAPGRLLP